MIRCALLVAVVLAFAAAGATLGSAAADHRPARAAPCVWKDTRLRLAGDATIEKVIVLSETDAWAIGEDASLGLLLVRWDGRRWTRRRHSFPDSVHLRALSASSATNVWAVGVDNATRRSVAMRWDGASWHLVPTPHLTGWRESDLVDVVALAANNVWAVGSANLSAGRVRPLIQHWNGSRWRTMPLPLAARTQGWLLGVAASSGRNVWATGAIRTRSPRGAAGHRALALRWRGRSWRQVRLPPSRYLLSELEDVIVASPRAAWIFGYSTPNPHTVTAAPYSFHWNGAGWQPFPPARLHLLTRAHRGGFWGISRREIYRFRGGAWTRMARVPFAAREDAEIHHVASSPAGTLWVVGWHYENDAIHTVITRYVCGQ